MKQKHNAKGRTFRRLSLLTVLAVYFLILVGGIVRSTGSGMGCPDWPKCFGQWIPPTHENQLPKGYQADYVTERVEKNQKFAAYLTAIGFERTAERIVKDEAVREPTPFNAAKTWTEYINRLIGAVIGLLIFATFVASFRYFKVDPVIFWLSLVALVTTGFQGWIGSVVVSTNLLPWMITLHMMLALLIVGILIYVSFRSYRHMVAPVRLSDCQRSTMGLLVLCIITLLSQIVLGTQVREAINTVAASVGYAARNLWIENLGMSFLIHRSYSLIILIMHSLLAYWLYRYVNRHHPIYQWVKLLWLLIVIEIASGAIMAYFAVPSWAQPVHLLLASVIFGVQFLMWLLLRNQHSQAYSTNSVI